MNDLTIKLVCDDCGEALDFELEAGLAHHGEYHDCFGEIVRDLAIIYDDTIRTLREGISIEVDQ